MRALINFIIAWIGTSFIVSITIGPFAYLLTVFPYEVFHGNFVHNPYVWDARIWMACYILWGIGAAFGTAAMFVVCREHWLEGR